MPYLDYQLGKITGWDGDPLEPEIDPAFAIFDNLRMPLASAEYVVEPVETPGADFHGLRIRETRSQVITATATLFTATVADGFVVRDLLRAWKPVADVPYYGVWAIVASAGGGPYDLLSVDLARHWRFVLNPVGNLIPGASVRFDYVLRLKERARPLEATT